MSNRNQYLLRSVQFASISFLGLTCLIISFSGDYARVFILSVLAAFCISFKVQNFKLLAKCGFCCVVVALFVQCCTRHEFLFIWSVGLSLILASVCGVAEKIRTWTILRGFCLFLAGLWCFSQDITGPQIRHTLNERKVVCLNRGSWGNVYDEGKGLTIRGQYSYNTFLSLIGAKSITSLEKLEENTELWLVTPTQPFTEAEKTKILNWIKDGGFLFVVSDHTNLFGHADVLNDLLSSLRIKVKPDCILDSSGDGGTYFSIFDDFKGLTSNSYQGVGVPWLVQMGYSERADYGRHSFFSDNQISDEEHSSIYTIGTTVPHGYGAVVLFGDSTLFANFALARPSSQALLERMLNLGKPLPWFSLSAVSLFCLLIASVWTECKTRFGVRILVWTTGCATLVILIISASPYLLNDFHLSFPDNALKASGDWELAEGNDSGYTTLFATCYNQSCGLPQWVGRKSNSNIILFSNGNTITAKDSSVSRSFDIPNVVDRLKNVPSMNSIDFVECLVNDSKFSSFWFDDGVGPFKELAYAQFWQHLCTRPKTDIVFPNLGTTYSASCSFTLRGGQAVNLEAKITPVDGLAPWVILGDWIVAQEVNKGVFLIRSQWQHPSWGRADAVLRLKK